MTLGILMMGLAALAGCRSMTGQSLGTNIDNKATTATVKAQLAAERLQNLGWVDVDTNAGTVYLSGTASSEAQKRRAEEIARNVDGVTKVVNNIQVKPQPTTGATSGASSTGSSSMGPSASPSDAMRRYSASGEVLHVDRTLNQLTLQSNTGRVVLKVPESALHDIQVGDRIAVELAIRQLR
jgi:hypothetical protein